MRVQINFRTITALIATSLLSVCHLTVSVAADDLTPQQLIDSLTSKTRAFDPERNAREKKFRSFVNTLRTKKTRQITVNERSEVAKFVKENDLPAIDLEIYFEYDSAAITQVALPKLATLGQALSDAGLKGKTFLIGGHTDARGSDTYNQSLSERRAEAVRTHLSTTYGLDPTNLIAIGYGEEQLKSPDTPEADQNRRVQIVNLDN